MKDTTTGDDIFNEVKALMTKFNLQLQNLRGFQRMGHLQLLVVEPV